MRRFKILFAFVAVACFYGFAQQALWSGAALKSPELRADRSAVFRLYAPEADSVSVSCDFLFEFVNSNRPQYTEKMEKDSTGVWTYTTPPMLVPELYSYSFLVDGVKTLDPSNVFVNRDVATLSNYFIVKGGCGDLYSVNDVPHGTVSRVWYYSKSLNMNRRMTVYTPAGYENGDSVYPVLYLLHGMGGDEEAWISLGRTAQILDNLIAQGKAEPMIVVMPNGNVSQEAAPGETPGRIDQPVFNLPKTMDGGMERSFLDIVEFVERTYRVDKSKSGRAIAGLSMGGFHSLHISKLYPDMFGYVGLFSAAIFPSDAPNGDTASDVYADMEGRLKVQFANPPELYWIGIGKDDFLYKANTEYRGMLDRIGAKYTYYETGEGHIWRNWRIYLSEFASLLFR